MAIQTKSNQSVFNIRYSAFLGMLYLSTTETESLINEAKAFVGVDEAKKGFKGSNGDTASARALNFLRQKGITAINVSGILTSAKIIDRDVDGRPTPYLNVGLKDGEERYFLSVNLSQDAAQMLVRKLVNAEIGVYTELNLFATYGGQYADHGASLRQRDIEVTSLSPKAQLAPRVESDKQKLLAAGITDKETLATRRAKIELDYHVELMTAVTAKVDGYYASKELIDTDTSAAA